MNLILKKDGYISTKRWVYDEEKGEGEHVYNLLKDDDPMILSYLQYSVELEEGFKVRDLLETVIRYSFLQALDSFWGDFVKEYEKSPANCVSDDIDYISIRKLVETTIYKNQENNDCQIFLGMSGIRKHEDVPYSMSFMPLKDFLDHELKTDKLMVSKDNYNIPIKERIQFIKDNPAEEWETSYSLGEVLHCFIFEISFYGTPEDTKKTKEGLIETTKNIEAGTEKLVKVDLEDLLNEKEK